MALAHTAQQIVDATAERFPGGMSAMPVANGDFLQRMLHN